jgi:putative alpha-1,2-mannosidase
MVTTVRWHTCFHVSFTAAVHQKLFTDGKQQSSRVCARDRANCAAGRSHPMIGASTSREPGEDKTFPGSTTPFGLVQLSPDIITGGDYGPGYSYEQTTIEGFSHLHLRDVGWYGDFGNLQGMAGRGTDEAGLWTAGPQRNSLSIASTRFIAGRTKVDFRTRREYQCPIETRPTRSLTVRYELFSSR